MQVAAVTRLRLRPFPRSQPYSTFIPDSSRSRQEDCGETHISLHGERCLWYRRLEIFAHAIVRSINIANNQSTPWSRLSPKFVVGFTKECKEAQIEARSLKRMTKCFRTEESWEQYRRARNRKAKSTSLRSPYILPPRNQDGMEGKVGVLKSMFFLDLQKQTSPTWTDANTQTTSSTPRNPHYISRN